jgi:hypothetical protein
LYKVFSTEYSSVLPAIDYSGFNPQEKYPEFPHEQVIRKANVQADQLKAILDQPTGEPYQGYETN